MATETDILLEAAKCYKCIPAGTQNEVIIYLLNELLDTPKTIQELLDGAKCYKCIPAGTQLEAQTFLLNEAYAILSTL